MDRHKNIGFVAVGNVASALQGNEIVGRARHHHLHIFLFVEKRAEFAGNFQIYAFFIGLGSERTRIFTAMPGVDNHCEIPGTKRTLRRPRHNGQNSYESEYVANGLYHKSINPCKVSKCFHIFTLAISIFSLFRQNISYFSQ